MFICSIFCIEGSNEIEPRSFLLSEIFLRHFLPLKVKGGKTLISEQQWLEKADSALEGI